VEKKKNLSLSWDLLCLDYWQPEDESAPNNQEPGSKLQQVHQKIRHLVLLLLWEVVVQTTHNRQM